MGSKDKAGREAKKPKKDKKGEGRADDVGDPAVDARRPRRASDGQAGALTAR